MERFYHSPIALIGGIGLVGYGGWHVFHNIVRPHLNRWF